MKNKNLIMVLILSFISNIAASQIDTVKYTISHTDRLDSSLFYMLENHINYLNSDPRIAALTNGFHLILIAPKFAKNDGIPTEALHKLGTIINKGLCKTF